jgi:hypothetical protein
MKRMLGTALAAALSVSAAAGAQTMEQMDKRTKDHKMTGTYTGCIEPATGGGFLLTHLAGSEDMPMHEKGMSKGMSASGMSGDGMMSTTVRVAGLSSLAKHVGQKVAIKGSVSHTSAEGMQGELPALAAVSLRVVSKSCS